MEDNTKNTFKEKIQSYIERFKWIYVYGKRHSLSIVVYTLLGLTATVVGLAGGLVSRDLVDIITGHRAGELIKTFAMMIGFQIMSILINNVSSYISTAISLKVENDIKADIYEKIMITDWESISQYHSGNIISRWAGDSASVANGVLNTFPNIIIQIFRFVSSLLLVIKYDWTFAIFVVVSVPLSFFVSRKNMERYRSINMENLEVSAKASAFSQDSFSNLQNVKALDMIKLYRKKLTEIQKETVDIRLKSQRTAIINSLILVCVSQLVTYSTYGWGVYRVWSGAISYGTMTMFLTLSQTLSGTAQSLLGVIPTTIGLANAAQRIIDIVELPKEDYSNEETLRELVEKHGDKGVGIKVEDVSFSYMSGTEVFDKVFFRANPRETVGLIGPSGEGKTTMLRLLLAIINPVNGKAFITADGNQEAITAAARQFIAYVPQGNTMFPGTIADNMRNVKEDATDEEIEEALKLACAWDFVSKLPEGINTEMKERGGGFSEGQAQRLSIARALIKRAPVLLLDEATSALDIETEKKVLANIAGAEYPRTCIVTTHRQEVMDACDRIYSINERVMKPKEIQHE